MFQEIAPYVYHNEFRRAVPEEGDYLTVSDGGRILLKSLSGGDLTLPTVGEVRDICDAAAEEAFYLFSIDERAFFFSLQKVQESGPSEGGEGFFYQNTGKIREMKDGGLLFGAAVAAQLGQWYTLHQYCGKCGVKTVRSERERAIQCPACGHVYYPRISPVVIVAVTDGERILLTRYRNAPYNRHALVAGFVEVGETLEDAIRREVREEVGLLVKNIRYCESQPWPFSSPLIAGFFADVDGEREVSLNTDGGEELAEGIWVRREDLVLEDSAFSLTWDMIRKFKNSEEPS